MGQNTPNFFKPIINLRINFLDFSLFVAEFSVDSGLRGKADTCQIQLEDQSGMRREVISKGDLISIAWGYEGGDLTEIFRGVVLDSNHNNPLLIRGVDYNTILNANKIIQTYQDDSVRGIMKAVMGNTGLQLEIEDCEMLIDRIPFFNCSIRECVDSLSTIAKRETGEEYFDYIRGNIFHWGRKDLSAEPSNVSTTGVNIIDFQLNETGLSELMTMISPVKHSQIIQIDGDNYFVENVEYNWKNGGRTRMGVIKT